MPDLYAYTDGACSGNPGPGGWGVLLLAKDGETVAHLRGYHGKNWRQITKSQRATYRDGFLIFDEVDDNLTEVTI